MLGRHWVALAGLALASCAEAVRYDTGAVVLDVRDPAAFESDGRTSPTYVAAYDAMRAGELAQAEVLLGRALVERPRDPYALLALGAVRERQGRFGEAGEHYLSAWRYGLESPADRQLAGAMERDYDGPTTVAAIARESYLRLGG